MRWSNGWCAGLPVMRLEVQIPARAEIWIEISAPPAPPSQLSYILNTLTAHYQWEGETARERTGHPRSYAEAKKMKSLTLHTLFFCFSCASNKPGLLVYTCMQ